MALAVGAAVAVLAEIESVLALAELDGPVVARLVPLEDELACPG